MMRIKPGIGIVFLSCVVSSSAFAGAPPLISAQLSNSMQQVMTHSTSTSPAFASPSGPIPANATMLSATQLAQLKTRSPFKIINAAQIALDQTAAAAALSSSQQIVSQFVSEHPKQSGFLNLDIDFSRVADMGNGSYVMTLDPDCTPTDSSSCDSIALMGSDGRTATLAQSISLFSQPENQFNIYKALHNRLTAFNKANPGAALQTLGSATIAQLPSLETAARMSPAELGTVLGLIISPSGGAKHPNSGNSSSSAPFDHFTNCSAEIGAGNGGDRISGKSHEVATLDTTERCSKFSSSGVMEHFDFANKPYLTCVKNQAAREVCWSFTAATLLETVYARDHQDASGNPVYLDLSKQHLINMQKLFWSPQPPYFRETNGLIDLLNNMVSHNYPMPYENAWNYNQSVKRVVSKPLKTFTTSCLGYYETCSDTNHQGSMYCEMEGSSVVCGYAPQFYLGTPGEGVPGLKPVVIWDPSQVDESVQTAQAFLENSIPLAVAFDVYPEFDAATRGGGWVLPPGNISAEKARGSHWSTIVGYIDDATMAAHPKISKKPQDGATGGGYFIIKNSWGTCSGDAGYYYMPVSYLKMFAITVVAAVDP